MHRRVALYLRVVAAAGPLLVAACAEPPPQTKAPSAAGRVLVRVATWNVHDLFDAVDRTTPPGDEDQVPSPAEVDAKIARIGTVLARIDADVVVLQEVENVELLQRLSAGPLAGQNYRAYLREGYDPRGIDVGVLSRVPFDTGPSHLDDRMPDGRRLWSRDVPEIHLGPGGPALVVVGAHLVSRLDPADDERRSLQAARLADIARGIEDGGHGPAVLVVGDLNDIPTSAALAPLLAQRGYADVGATLSPSAGWTWSGGGAHERIDYAVLCGVDRVVITRVQVEAGSDVSAASDHRPVVVDLWVGPDAR